MGYSGIIRNKSHLKQNKQIQGFGGKPSALASSNPAHLTSLVGAFQSKGVTHTSNHQSGQINLPIIPIYLNSIPQAFPIRKDLESSNWNNKV